MRILFFLIVFSFSFLPQNALAVDSTAPFVTEVIQETSVGSTFNTDGGDVTIQFLLRASDDISGVCASCSDLMVTEDGSGKEHPLSYYGAVSYVSGGIQDALYRGEVTLPQHAPNGEYRISLFLRDNNGNFTSVGSTIKSQLWGANFTNIGTSEDEVDPFVSGAPTATPSLINTDLGDQIVQVRFRAQDARSGICTEADGCLRPSTLDFGTSTTDKVSIFRISGNELDGEYGADVIFPRGSLSNRGLDITLYDQVGNAFYYESSFEVDNTGVLDDNEDPVIAKIHSISPEFFGTNDVGAKRVDVILDITDNMSGVCANNDGDCYKPFEIYIPTGLSTVDDYTLTRLSGTKN